MSYKEDIRNIIMQISDSLYNIIRNMNVKCMGVQIFYL